MFFSVCFFSVCFPIEPAFLFGPRGSSSLATHVPSSSQGAIREGAASGPIDASFKTASLSLNMPLLVRSGLENWETAVLHRLDETAVAVASDTRRGVLLQEVRRGPKTSPRACCKKLGEVPRVPRWRFRQSLGLSGPETLGIPRPRGPAGCQTLCLKRLGDR